MKSASKVIKTGDIFLAKYSNYYGKNKAHYFYCIYSQEEDINNHLNEDIIGLMITSNPKMEDIIKNYNDYNVKVKIYTTEAYVCCDKIFRFNTKDKVVNHGDLLDELEKQDILEHYKKFIGETLRQLKDEK